jgi:hypothetical protein
MDANPFGAPPAAKSTRKSSKTGPTAAVGHNGNVSSRKSSSKQRPIEETLAIPESHMARVDANAISKLHTLRIPHTCKIGFDTLISVQSDFRH